jgi:hypothetical protein
MLSKKHKYVLNYIQISFKILTKIVKVPRQHQSYRTCDKSPTIIIKNKKNNGVEYSDDWDDMGNIDCDALDDLQVDFPYLF